MKRSRTITAALACLGLALSAQGCGGGSSVHSDSELLDALLTVEDVETIVPAEWEENMRTVVETPVAPWENTLDPYLCNEATTPDAMTRSQAQLELTGGSVMQILISAEDAGDLYDGVIEAYEACGTGSSLPYSELADGPSVGDESVTYRSSLGVVTVARFDTDLMILKWWVGDFYDETIEFYPDIVAAAAQRISEI